MARILVVDDEEGIRSFLAETLSLEGYDVEQAANGDDAWQAVRARRFDVVLTDLKMPGLDGMGLLDRVRSEEPGTEVIMLTAHGTVATAVEAVRRGAYDFLEKPLSSPEELCLLVSRAVERRRLLIHAEQSARASDPDPPLTHGDVAMRPIVDALSKVAKTDATVLLLGESGTGKEVAARALHRWSRRCEAPFVAINCAAISSQLLESELFGHEKGAFTGAHAQRRGRIELAEGGTFFLDEVGELAKGLQAKLLRVLEERTHERVGGTKTIKADVRWVAATNQDLGAAISRGDFREDLYHRLAVFPIVLPPLRERPADIRPLAQVLLSHIAASLGKPRLVLAEEVAEQLATARWPGNVRELRNALERAAILADGEVIEPAHLWLDPTRAQRADSPHENRAETLEAMERRAITNALAAVSGNRKEAAARLGIGLRTLYDKLKLYALQ